MREYIVKFDTDEPPSEFPYGTNVRALMKITGDCDEIIRCKDCKYAKMTISGDSAKYCLAWQGEDALMDSLYLPADFYCGFAERKEE